MATSACTSSKYCAPCKILWLAKTVDYEQLKKTIGFVAEFLATAFCMVHMTLETIARLSNTPVVKLAGLEA